MNSLFDFDVVSLFPTVLSTEILYISEDNFFQDNTEIFQEEKLITLTSRWNGLRENSVKLMTVNFHPGLLGKLHLVQAHRIH